MPFIRGRYHINPVMALEAAREAEAALLARQDSSNNESDATGDDSYTDDGTGYRSASPAATSAKGPVHRVEIDAAEQTGLPGGRLGEPGRSVPNHSGRAARGFVVRVHHTAATAPDDASGSDANGWRDALPPAAPAPETHVFSAHGDLVDFLRSALAPDDSR